MTLMLEQLKKDLDDFDGAAEELAELIDAEGVSIGRDGLVKFRQGLATVLAAVDAALARA